MQVAQPQFQSHVALIERHLLATADMPWPPICHWCLLIKLGIAKNEKICWVICYDIHVYPHWQIFI